MIVLKIRKKIIKHLSPSHTFYSICFESDIFQGFLIVQKELVYCFYFFEKINEKENNELALIQDFIPFVADAAPFFYN